ncbi:MAG: thioredoxin domain-containing protein [Caldilineaceae bacterium]|nr:thioredoxin domain-containing protein [Caldilineaceae bacterium]
MRVEPEIVANFVAQGRVKLAFWHVLDHGTPSQVAHVAAECAGAQDPLSFWRMHDVLFERQGELWRDTATVVTGMAGELGLDTNAFAACLADPAVNEKVMRMDSERQAAGIRLRPSFDLNGRILPGSQPFETFARLFEETE